MAELWLEDNKLIKQKKWVKLIESFRNRNLITDKSEAKQQLKKLLINAIKIRIPNTKFGILFSGGVDSTFIAAVCKELRADFTCYTVGFQNEDTKEPEDVVEAKKVAQELGFRLKYKVYNLKEAEEIIKATVKILKEVGKTDVVNGGVGSVVLAAIKLAKEDNLDYFLGGLGSEELFAGYERHGKAVDKHEECWTGLNKMHSRDLVRDFTIAKEMNVTIKTPFLDQDLIEYSMQLPAEWKIDEKEKKIILREVAEESLGKHAWRKKKAAQYGSCFDKAIGKLAKKYKFNLKKEWLDSLC